jgi:hypothetical protein
VKRSKDRVHEHKRRFEEHSLTSPGWRQSRGAFSDVLCSVSRGPAKETLCCGTKIAESCWLCEARFLGVVHVCGCAACRGCLLTRLTVTLLV